MCLWIAGTSREISETEKNSLLTRALHINECCSTLGVELISLIQSIDPSKLNSEDGNYLKWNWN
jgi:hypothetical protein